MFQRLAPFGRTLIRTSRSTLQGCKGLSKTLYEINARITWLQPYACNPCACTRSTSDHMHGCATGSFRPTRTGSSATVEGRKISLWQAVSNCRLDGHISVHLR